MKRRSRSTRRGAIIPLVAIMLVILLGMCAFAIDYGYMLKTQGELQNTADSAALAGAQQLLNQSQLTGSYDATGVMYAAQTKAQYFAPLHKAGGKAIAMQSADIVCGYIANPRDQTSPFTTGTTPYNSVQVTAQRTAQENGSLNLFFARLLGTNAADLKATATATYDGNLKGFKFAPNPSTPQTCSLLPFALDVNTWNQIISGTGPDAWSYDPSTKAVTSGSDNIKEAMVFPSKSGAGNFGTVNIGTTNNGTGNLMRQVQNGPNAADFDNMGGQVALGSNGTLMLNGNPGISAAIGNSVQSIIGQPRTLMLYQPPAPNGASGQYTIVGFAGVVICWVQLTGPDKFVAIQPEIVIDNTAYGGGPITNNRFVFPPLQLTR